MCDFFLLRPELLLLLLFVASLSANHLFLATQEAVFRTALLKKVQQFADIDRSLVDRNADRVKAATDEVAALKKAGWGIGLSPGGCSGSGGDVPASVEDKDAEIRRLRAALQRMSEQGETVPVDVFGEAAATYNKEVRAKNDSLAKVSGDMERYVGETKELRNSLLKDLQSRCEKVIDMELALDESREQYKNLMVASSNKLLRKRVKMLELQASQQTGNAAQVINENSTLRLEYKLAEKKLAIRNERIENLKTGLKEEKRHIKELRENANAERAKYRQELARYREELTFWKDKCLKSAATAMHQATASKTGRIVKVLKGGQRHESPHHAPLTPTTPDEPPLLG